MDSKEIRELIQLISRSNFSTFELERNGFRIKLVKGAEAAPTAAVVPERAAVVAAVEGPAGVEARAAAPAGPQTEPAPAEAADQAALHEMHSPIVGTFYSAPGPDAPDFVEVGSQVRKGQVVCIIEAMKVMNEIESEIDAEVVDVLVHSGQPVEFGEVMFRLRPL